MDNKQVSVVQGSSSKTSTKSVNSFRPPVQPVIGSIYEAASGQRTVPSANKQSSQSSQAVLADTTQSVPGQMDSSQSPLETDQYSSSLPSPDKQTPPPQVPNVVQVQSYQNSGHSEKNNRPEEQNVQPPVQQKQSPPQQQQQPNQEPQPQEVTVSPPPIKPLLSPELAQNNIGSDVDKAEQPKQPSTPQKAVVTKVKLSDELNLFDWFRATDIINQIAEKARSSMDSVITTLDPGMKEYLYSGGNINILVISDKDKIVGSIFDSFQSVFGRATVTSDSQSAPKTASTIKQDYPIKLACGLNQASTIARDKIRKLRLDTSSVPQNQVILAIQPALVQIQEEPSDTTPEIENDQPSKTHESGIYNWFLTYCMIIEDPVLGATLSAYSQFIPLDLNVVSMAKDAKSGDDKEDGRLGFPISIDELMTASAKPSDPNNGDWLRTWSGLDEQEIIRDLSLVLAKTYRRKWNECVAHT